MEEIDEDTVWYVFAHCQSLMTGTEHDAYHKIISEMLIEERGGSEAWRNFFIRVGKLKAEYPPEVYYLAKDGQEVLEQKIAKRILKEQSNHPLFNYCPKCSKLARTPLAKQCRFCRHNWH